MKKATKKILSLVMAMAVALGMFTFAPMTAHAAGAAGETYTQRPAGSAPVSGGKYLFVANIYKHLYGNPPVKPLVNMALGAVGQNNSLLGSEDFTLSGANLTSTADLSAWEFTLTAAGQDAGGNPGYTIKSSAGAFLDLRQDRNGMWNSITPSHYGNWPAGAYATFVEDVSFPFTTLSNTPRTWYWDGNMFYTYFTSDRTSVGQLMSGTQNDYILMPRAGQPSGVGLISWQDKEYTNRKFFLQAEHPGDGIKIPGQQWKDYQDPFADVNAVALASKTYSHEYLGTTGGHPSYAVKNITLYQKDSTYSNATVNIRLDGATYTNMTEYAAHYYPAIVLRKGGIEVATGTITNGKATFGGPLSTGTYDVFYFEDASGATTRDTGVDLFVNDNGAAADLDFYTVTMLLNELGYAYGSAVSGKFRDTNIAFAGGPVLKGRQLVFSAAAAGSAVNYAYQWGGLAAGSASTSTVTIVGKGVASVTITGYTKPNITPFDTMVSNNTTTPIPLEQLFNVSPPDADSAVSRTYAIIGGTGSGFICDAAGNPDSKGQYLLVSKSGNFEIRLNTSAGGVYLAHAAEAMLTMVQHLTGIIPPAPVSVDNGVPKTETGLRLPVLIRVTTDSGEAWVSVTWDITSANYDPADTMAQSFAVTGAVQLSDSVINPNSIPLNVSISVKVFSKNGIPPVVKLQSTIYTGMVGTPFTQQLETTQGDSPITWSLADGTLPGGLTLDSNTGLISGTPQSAGTFNFTVKAENDAGFGIKPYRLDVDPAPNSFAITASANAGGSISPSGTHTVARDGSIQFTLMPDAGYIIHNVTVDGVPQTVTGSLYTLSNVTSDITIVANFVPAAPKITTSSLPAFRIGYAHNVQLAATGVQPITWTIVGGNLPGGLTLLPSGLISGTATNEGSGSATIMASNNYGSDTLQSIYYTHTTVPAGVPPTITTDVLPDGVLNTAYNATLAATGATPITWALKSGPLPTGLNLNASGEISGTPTADGTFNFIVEATNTVGSVVKALSITVSGAAPSAFTITSSAGANGSISPLGARSVDIGDDATYTIIPNANYEIADVLVDGGSVGTPNSYTFDDVDASHTISASFKPVVVTSYTITASAGIGGSILPDGSTAVNVGDNQSFTITPDANYAILDVLVDGVSKGAIDTFTFNNVTANHTITATFRSTMHMITASSSADGSITPSGQMLVSNGSNNTFSITPDTGCFIVSVLVDGQIVSPPPNTYAFNNVIADHAISVTFRSLTHSITASAGAGGSITPSGIATVNDGDSQTYTIAPNANYVIESVLVDGVSMGAIGTYTFSNVTANHTIEASFRIPGSGGGGGGGGYIPPAPVTPVAPQTAFPCKGEVTGKRIDVFKFESLKTRLFRLNKGDEFTILGLANKGGAFEIEQNGRRGFIAFKDIKATFSAAIKATALKKAGAYNLLESGKLKRVGYYPKEQILWVHGIMGKYFINKQTNATYYLDAAQWRLSLSAASGG